ncbi:TPA: hypothetical protein ABHN85_17530 [Pseudomonas sp. H2]|uniref:hypothetical protein n=1 Tax=Pseudomonas sp. H2 TaxID=658612 RepID=UPI000512F3DE|nr:hypothetical protein [Pseudomonas sp. H2]KGI92401.1 hypothetical protein MD26_15940 [Pseudomonas sp. H2]
MTLMVRMVNKAKWNMSFDPANADAITVCLKTKNNTLSFWTVESEKAVDEGVLAIASANQNLDSLDIVVIDSGEFEAHEIKIIETDGKTACADLVKSHRDLAELDVRDLEAVSNVIAKKMRENKVVRYNMSRIRDLIEDAIRAKRIDPEKLHEGIRKKLTI